MRYKDRTPDAQAIRGALRNCEQSPLSFAMLRSVNRSCFRKTKSIVTSPLLASSFRSLDMFAGRFTEQRIDSRIGLHDGIFHGIRRSAHRAFVVVHVSERGHGDESIE